MRFDEINIIGEFKINGLTGSPGQALGLSGSDFTWITVSASSVIDAVLLTGADYVICQSINTGNPGTDAIENGNRLKSAYATASALYVSNRVSVLITPGDYDFGATPLQLTTTKVDLIGLSSDASDVILRGSGDYVLQIINSNTDTALCNVTLDGTSTTLHSFDNSGTNSCYLRWDNVIATGNIFTDDDVSSYTDLNGEFKNIKVYSSPYAFYTLNGNIDGVYDNIELTDVNYGFFSNGGFLLGTYSNITLSGTLIQFFLTGADPINASFENIKCGNINQIFSSYQINGTFRNIEIGDVDYVFSSNGVMDGIFENIKIGNSSAYCFVSTNGNLTGTYSNIEIGDCTNAFYTDTSGSILGSFKDITVGSSSNIFSVYDNISGTFENIKTGFIGQYIFKSLSSGNVLGTFNNIEISDVAADVFVGGYISGTFSNIKTKDISSDFFMSSSNLEGSFENIKTGNLYDSFQATSGDILGTFRNIEVGDVGLIFRAGGTMSTIFDTINIGNLTTNAFSAINSLSGTFSNIEIGNGSDVFNTTNFHISGTFKNIKIGNLSSNAFTTGTGYINGHFDKIEIGDATAAFSCGNNLYGTYKNIEMGNVTNYVFYANNNIDGIFDNIKVINSNNFFYSLDALYGTFSNIEANGQITNAFSADSTGADGQYKNLTLGTVSNLFYTGGIVGVPVVIDNLKANSYLNGFGGKITNSTIDSRGLSSSAISITDQLGTPIIERCKFLSDSGYITIDSSLGSTNAQISFTITNYGITSSITNDISTPLNINNPNIT